MVASRKPVQGRRTPDEVVRYHLEQQRRSGKTVEAYCRDEGFSSWTFQLWRKRVAAESTDTKQTGLSFVEMPVTRHTSAAYELSVGGAMVLRFDRSCDVAEVGRLAAALHGSIQAG